MTAGANATSLHGELERFRAELRAAGLRESTVRSYLMGSTYFVRWLGGDYAPATRGVGESPEQSSRRSLSASAGAGGP